MDNLVLLDSVKKFPLMALPVRSTAVKLKNGSYVLISPGSQLTKEQLRSLSSVSDLVAPNVLHNAGMKQAQEVFPNAKTWGVEGLKYPSLVTAETWPYQEELVAIPLEGMPRLNEVVFVHKKSKTLITTDSAFNVLNPKGVGSWVIMNMFGNYKRFAVSKFFMKLVKDRAAFERSLKKLFAEDFDNIIVSHGNAIIGQGKEKLRAAFAERSVHL